MLAVIDTLYDQPEKVGFSATVTRPAVKSAVRLPEPRVPGAMVPSDPVGLV